MKLNPIIIILTLALILSLVLNMHSRTRVDAMTSSEAINRNRYESNMNALIMFRDFEAQSNGLKVDKHVAVVNKEGETFPFQELVYGNIRVLKFSKSNCSDCMKQNFQLVLDMMNGEMPDNLILLAEFSNLREVRLLSQMFELNWPVYFLPASLELPIDQLGEPYFFEVDENLTCSNFQIAAGESTGLVQSYLRALASKNNH